MANGDESEWDVRIEDGTVVVELPRKLALDAQATERMHEALSTAVARPEVERVLTVVDVEHPLSKALHDVVRRTARTAAAHDVTSWHIVAEHKTKGVALEREIPGLETAVFTDERDARNRQARPAATLD